MGLLDDAIREHLDLKRRRGADPGEVERLEREALGPVRRDPLPTASDEAALPHAYADEEAGGYDDVESYAEPDFGEEAYPQAAGDRDPRAYEERPAYDEPASYVEPDDSRSRRSALGAPEQSLGGERFGSAEPPPEVKPVKFQRRSLRDRLTHREPQAPPPPDLEPQDSGRGPAPHPAAAPDEETEALNRFRRASQGGASGASDASAPGDPHVTPYSEPAGAEPIEPDSRADAPAPLSDETVEYRAVEPEEEQGEAILEETPEFLQDTPDHDRLWFEQRPPRDFDFDG